MEGRQTKRKKSFALIVVLAAAALLCLGQPQPASAQFPQVAPNGVGDLLTFQYWTTTDRDTLIAITNPFGPVQVAGTNASRFVHIRVREGVGSADVRNFTICLSPGDVWTAAISAGLGASVLTVGNPGSCDALVGAFSFTPPPLPGQPVAIGATFGYIEAFTMEAGGGDDAIMGVATPVNVGGGFSSSYNATAIVGLDAANETATVLGAAFQQAIARQGGVDKEILLTRWTAAPEIGSSTQVVLTFPGGGIPRLFNPATATFTQDQLSAWFFDENELFNFSPRAFFLPWEVNVCTIDTNPTTGNTRFSCPTTATLPVNTFDVIGPGGTFTGGWVRIINNTLLTVPGGALGGIEVDDINDLPTARFPVLGLVFSSFVGGAGDFDQSFPIQWAAVVGAGGFGGTVSFDIASSAAPWFLRGGTRLVDPGDNTTGGLARTGGTAP